MRQTLRERLQRWMLRGRPPEQLPVTLGQRRIYVLPTGPGLSFGLLLLAMLLASLNYTLSLGFALTFVLAGVGHLSMVRAHRNLLGVTLQSGRCDAVFAGEPRALSLVMQEQAGRERPSLAIMHTASAPVGFSIPARGAQALSLPLPAQSRGRHPVGRLRLETRHPLGLIVAWSYFEPAVYGLVYPTPEVEPPTAPSHHGNGEGRPVPGSDGVLFDSLRPYRAGDPLRQIAWRQLARGGTLATKHFAAEAGGEQWLRWADCPASMDTEARLSRLCAWALKADEAKQRFGLELPGRHIAPGSGTAHLREVLEALARHGVTEHA
ncbi:DUF58 domain-containing protein [Niveibacterium microcysteis]|uniref:DUF58 domain-containing protein n=1 Tax=Niveibacterium microcysteis TaxID=2811415 RepID=A0ABX7MCE1_9RHOO|nr:DUF58 domain-containing protein [Niveibacterium microcysteis]QSI78586.1 DUF58 domain-containing protein [Niveibacterium microcysteis]